jgi:hypothetical protein
MDEPITATLALKQDTSLSLFEERDGPPGECATMCKKQSKHIMLEISCSTEEQPGDQPDEQPDEQCNDQPTDQPEDGPGVGRPEDPPADPPEEQPADQPDEQRNDQPDAQEKDKAKTQGIPSWPNTYIGDIRGKIAI